ncbi:MAG: hypothetical protein AAGN66_24825 [Acidobacteriota bacterium]
MGPSTPYRLRCLGPLLAATIAALLCIVLEPALARPSGPASPQPPGTTLETERALDRGPGPIALPPIPPADWQRFPLMMINVGDVDVPNVVDLVDVVAYYSSFAPFEAFGATTQAEADADSFRIDEHVLPLLAAAEAAGLHMTVTPALLAHRSAPGSLDPLLTGDGVTDGTGLQLFVNPAVVPGCNDVDVDAACIRVPTRYDEVTPEYVAYWSSKLPAFLQAVGAADLTQRVWGLYGTEEIRTWGEEYDAQVALRDALDADPTLSGRLLISTTPHHRMPQDMAETMLAIPGVAGAVGSVAFSHDVRNPRSFEPIWDNPGCWRVTDTCNALAFGDYYPRQMSFATDAAGEVMPLQDHMIRGNYQGLLMGANSHRNRIGSIHRIEAQIEALSIVRSAYVANGQAPPSPLPFHAPDMNLCSLAEAGTSSAEARHDFWSGLHRARGVFIYNYQSVVQAESGAFGNLCPVLPTPAALLTVWDEFEHGLGLIKGTLREYFLNGIRTPRVQFQNVSASVMETIPGTDYLIDQPIPLANAAFAMPDYDALNGSSYRMGTTEYLIVTSSFDQDVTFTVPFDNTICSVSVVHGDGSAVSFAGGLLHDGMQGIDGRVYRIDFALGASCSLAP